MKHAITFNFEFAQHLSQEDIESLKTAIANWADQQVDDFVNFDDGSFVSVETESDS